MKRGIKLTFALKTEFIINLSVLLDESMKPNLTLILISRWGLKDLWRKFLMRNLSSIFIAVLEEVRLEQ
jgi:hypothetical protein